MKAWLMDGMHGVDKLRVGDAPEPKANPGEVVLEIEYASLNPADRYMSEGMYPGKPAMPHILGRDGVGTIIAVGPGENQFKAGQKMMILRGDVGVNRPGTFAQRVSVPLESLAPLPVGWNEQESAAASLVYLTAYQAMTQWGMLAPSVVLITGASGGVGVAGVHLARAMGHTVIALSRSEEKRKKLLTLGAAIALDPADAGWKKKCKEFLAPRRVDLAIDNVGGSLLPDVIDTLGNNGKVSVVGRLAGPVPEFNTASLFFRRIKLGGVAVGTYTSAETHAAWDEVLRFLRAAGAKPIVDSVFKFEELRAAFDRLEKGPMGKVLIKVDSRQ